MSDMISGPPKTVQESHNLRTVRSVKLNEERSDEDRHLAEMEERMRSAKRRKARREGVQASERGKVVSGKPGSGQKSNEPGGSQRGREGHIDFTA